MNSIAIIGAGITGLTAAFYLKRKGLPVTVYEASGRVGGVIETLRRDGYLAEFGPNTILETSPKITQLVLDAGLQSRRLDPDPKAEARYVVRYKRPIAMPGSPAGFFATDLFSYRAKLAVLREPFVPRRRDGPEESIAEFVVRRLNREFLDQAIDALVAGIYAGDPWKLSVSQAFPRLAELERRYGSLIKGQIFGARERKRRGEVAKDRAPKFSFDEGLQVLPETLRERLGPDVRLHTSVTRLTRTERGWTLWLRDSRVEHSAVIYAGTAFGLAGLEVEVAGKPGALAPAFSHPMGAGVRRTEKGLPDPLRGSDNEPGRTGQGDVATALAADAKRLNLIPFSEIRYPPVASVVLGFRRADVEHPCEGFGMLIPKIECFRILGTIFSSSLFPNRAPAGHLTLTSYIGGERCPELASLPPERLYAVTCEDLRVLLGVRGKPTFQHCVLYPKAIPQYNVGYGRYRDLMTDMEAKAPGLFLAGHYRDGISVGDCIVSGHNTAERVAEVFKH